MELPPYWELYYDENGWPYYYNTSTGESSWDPPSNEIYDAPVITTSVDSNKNAYGGYQSSSVKMSPLHISALNCSVEALRIMVCLFFFLQKMYSNFLFCRVVFSFSLDIMLIPLMKMEILLFI